MDVGVNAHLLTFSQGYRNAGVGRYIYYLLQALAERGDRDGTRYTVFCHDAPRPGDPARGPLTRFVTSRLDTIEPKKRIPYEQAVLPWLLPGRVDLLHAPVNVVPLLAAVPAVVTVHDLAFMAMPERFLPAKRRYLETFTRLTMRKARHVIADSAHTRADLITLLGVPPERVTAVPLGVNRDFHPPDEEARTLFRARENLPGRYLLYLGTLEPRKNLVALVRAYARLRKRGLEWPLVLAGGKGWLYEDIFRAVEEEGLAEHVRFPGYVRYEDQPLWYGCATLFVYPSTYEGFGLPVLEAMACGAPVVASNASSLPEAAGDAALLVDPHDEEALAAAVERLAGDGALRADLAARGLARAALFPWSRTAAETVRVYAAAVDSR
jgi:glycosyltransferase involved in cell wall biosynthesis